MTIPTPTVPLINNPATGVFGNGLVQFFPASGTFTVPLGVSRIRVRVWGAGGTSNSSLGGGLGGGGGGGFAMKVINVTPASTVAVTVGTGFTTVAGGTSSFGSSVSATGGNAVITAVAAGATGGTGIGGDINYIVGTGGTGDTSSFVGGGGGAAGVFGNGGNGGNTIVTRGGNGNSGGGGGGTSGASGSGFFNLPSSLLPTTSLDFIATGNGGTGSTVAPTNGGGGSGASGSLGPGFPGGGSAYNSTAGANGLVIVEY